MARSESQGFRIQTQRPSLHVGNTLPGSNPRASYNDPAQVRQWAANSAAGAEAWINGQFDMACSNNLPVDCVTSSTSGAYPVTHGLQTQFPFALPAARQANGLGFHYPVEGQYPRIAPGSRDIDLEILNTQEPEFSMDHHEGIDLNDYTIPGDNQMYFASNADGVLSDPNAQGLSLPTEWSSHGFNGDFTTDSCCAPQPMTLSPSSGFEVTSSSSYSQHSFLDTPTSMAVPEDFTWSSDHMGQGDNGTYLPLNVPETLQLPSALASSDDTSVPVMQGQMYQGNPDTFLEMWQQIQIDTTAQVYATPSSSNNSRRPSGGEMLAARSHPLYLIDQDSDGSWHCPMDNCSQKFTLKCNYHKHLDSHLKPFRCRVQECEKVQFSSTACLLRHEREAHGFHGHGDKPFLCIYPECERAYRGFPRPYNLNDHMKRCHQWVPPDASNSSNSPSPSSTSSYQSGEVNLPIRRKRNTEPSKGGAAKKAKGANSSKSTTKAKKAESAQLKRMDGLRQQWMALKAQIHATSSNLDSNDVDACAQLRANCVILQSITEQIQSEESLRRPS